MDVRKPIFVEPPTASDRADPALFAGVRRNKVFAMTGDRENAIMHLGLNVPADIWTNGDCRSNAGAGTCCSVRADTMIRLWEA